jgi:hypothetical protein
MWFAFGLVTLAASIAYQWWHRWQRNWSGTPDVIGGFSCETKLREFKGIVYGLTVGIWAPKSFRFDLKREGGWDRLFKWLGLSVEVQFGHAGFDPLVYVASNDQHLVDCFAGNKAILHEVQHLFATEHDGGRVKRVGCANGRLWMDVGSDPTGEEGQKITRETAAALMVHLQQFASILRAAEPSTSPASRDPFLVTTVALLSLSSGMAINGFVSWWRSLVASPAFLLDTHQFWGWTWFVGVLILLMLILATLILLGRSARVHLVLMEVLLVGSFGAISTSAIELRDANIEWDKSPPETLQRKLVGKKAQERRRLFRTRHLYALEVRDWASPGEFLRVRVSREIFDQAKVGDTLVFEQHAGYFGWRWAEFKAWKPAEMPPT